MIEAFEVSTYDWNMAVREPHDKPFTYFRGMEVDSDVNVDPSRFDLFPADMARVPCSFESTACTEMRRGNTEERTVVIHVLPNCHRVEQYDKKLVRIVWNMDGCSNFVVLQGNGKARGSNVMARPGTEHALTEKSLRERGRRSGIGCLGIRRLRRR